MGVEKFKEVSPADDEPDVIEEGEAVEGDIETSQEEMEAVKELDEEVDGLISEVKEVAELGEAVKEAQEYEEYLRDFQEEVELIGSTYSLRAIEAFGAGFVAAAASFVTLAELKGIEFVSSSDSVIMNQVLTIAETLQRGGLIGEAGIAAAVLGSALAVGFRIKGYVEQYKEKRLQEKVLKNASQS